MRINLKKLIKDQGMTKKAMADVLFPMNAHPVPALDRVLSGESFLDENQISLLSARLGLTVSQLFEGTNWNAKAKPDGVHTFTDGEYEAELDTDTMSLKFFQKGSLKHETLLLPRAVKLSEVIYLLNKLKC